MEKIGTALPQAFSLEEDREIFNNPVHPLDNNEHSWCGPKS